MEWVTNEGALCESVCESGYKESRLRRWL